MDTASVSAKKPRGGTMPIGETVKRLREAADMTQWELAERSRLSLGVIARIEQGEQDNPQLRTLKALAHGLGVSMNELTAGDEPEPKPRGQRKRKKKGTP